MQMLLGWGVFNETQGSIMSPDMFGFAWLQSIRRSHKWAHVKAINLLSGETLPTSSSGDIKELACIEGGFQANEGTQDVYIHGLYSCVIKNYSVL